MTTKDLVDKIRGSRSKKMSYIKYTQYIVEEMDKSISWSEYLCDVDNISYSQYVVEKLDKSVHRYDASRGF